MISKLKLCKGKCGKHTSLWSKGLCKICYFQQFPPKPISKISKKGIEKRAEKKIKSKKLHVWFVEEIWNKRPHFSEISGKWLGNEANLCFFHHIFPKSLHPDFEFMVENIILLTASEHQEVELNPTKFEKINKIRLKIANMDKKKKEEEIPQDIKEEMEEEFGELVKEEEIPKGNYIIGIDPFEQKEED